MSAKAAPGALDELGDFTATPRLLPVGLIAIAIGLVASFVAKGLLTLIDFFTNLFFFHRISIVHVSPADHALGLAVVAVPVVGALIIGI
ncbi:MAG TPA: chloride channel protein, partial [Candidatus Eisenbacteria bacterium]|nr:chloride channel protein [Candidatus Eisenbacteria bacterium]